VSGFVPKNLAIMPFEFCMKMKDPRVLRGDKDRLCVTLYICRNLCSITEGLLYNTALLTTPPSKIQPLATRRCLTLLADSMAHMSSPAKSRQVLVLWGWKNGQAVH